MNKIILVENIGLLFLQKQYLFCYNILLKQEFYNVKIFHFFKKEILKLFYILYLIRELTFFLNYNVINFETHTIYQKLSLIFDNIVEFCNVLNYNNLFFFELNILLNNFIIELYNFYIYFDLDKSFLIFNVDVYDNLYLENNIKYFLMYFTFELKNIFPFIIVDNNNNLENFLQYEIKLIDYYNLIKNDINILTNKIILEKLYFLFFHIYLQIQLSRLFFNLIDLDYLLNIYKIFLDNFFNQKIYLDFFFNTIISVIFKILKNIKNLASNVDYSDSLLKKLNLIYFNKELQLFSINCLQFIIEKKIFDIFIFNFFNNLFFIKYFFFFFDNIDFPTKELYLIYKLYQKLIFIFSEYKKGLFNFNLLYNVYNECLQLYFNVNILPLNNKFINSLENKDLNIDFIFLKNRFIFFKSLIISFFNFCSFLFSFDTQILLNSSIFCSFSEFQSLILNYFNLYNQILLKQDNNINIAFDYNLCLTLYFFLFELQLFCIYLNIFENNISFYFNLLFNNTIDLSKLNYKEIVFNILDDIFLKIKNILLIFENKKIDD